MSKHTFVCIDVHACGNPVRVVKSGGSNLIGKTMNEKRLHFLKEYDWIRKGLMFEPRGYDMMSGSILYPPHNPDNDFAVLFIETSGCLPMCGHGLIEVKVAVTLMNGFTRLAGTMEIDGINHKINAVRVNSIARAAENYYPNVKVNQQEKELAKCGLRPCSPDGLPYIVKSKKCKNVTFATGHAMIGWSLGPATGKLVSEIISDKKTALDLSPFSVDRKF
jgi:glycine/D-amino acid oxidase-like deaminating enzyme